MLRCAKKVSFKHAGFCPSTDWDTVDFKSAPAIQELPITSVVCSPTEGSTVKLKENKLPVKGYAWSGGGRRVVRVDVSADGGQTWVPAQLHSEDDTLHKAWGWTLWRVRELFHCDFFFPLANHRLFLCGHRHLESRYFRYAEKHCSALATLNRENSSTNTRMSRSGRDER